MFKRRSGCFWIKHELESQHFLWFSVWTQTPWLSYLQNYLKPLFDCWKKKCLRVCVRVCGHDMLRMTPRVKDGVSCLGHTVTRCLFVYVCVCVFTVYLWRPSGKGWSRWGEIPLLFVITLLSVLTLLQEYTFLCKEYRVGLIERGQRSDSEPGVLLADRDFGMAVVCCLLPFFVDFFFLYFLWTMWTNSTVSVNFYVLRLSSRDVKLI